MCYRKAELFDHTHRGLFDREQGLFNRESSRGKFIEEFHGYFILAKTFPTGISSTGCPSSKRRERLVSGFPRYVWGLEAILHSRDEMRPQVLALSALVLLCAPQPVTSQTQEGIQVFEFCLNDMYDMLMALWETRTVCELLLSRLTIHHVG